MRDALRETPRGVVVHDEVEITLPVALLLVGETVPLFRAAVVATSTSSRSAVTFTDSSPVRVLEERAFGAEDVAEVLTLERVVGLRAPGIAGT